MPVPADAQPRPDGAPATAAVLLIGNELLSGKVRDENGWFMARLLRRRGIALVEIATVPDEVDAIVDALRRLLGRCTLVFTSGGVGPTHDDVTLEAVAAATGRPRVRHPVLEQRLRDHFGPTVGEAALSMADLPTGTELRALPGWPVLRLDVDDPAPARLYILPGIPALFRAKIEAIEALVGELPHGEGWALVSLVTRVEESELAPILQRLTERHAGVQIGSYPRWQPDHEGRLRHFVRVTFEAWGAADDAARRACEELRASLPADSLVPEPQPTDDGA